MSNDFKIVSIYDDDPSKSLPNVGIVDMDSRLPVHKGDEDYNATVQQLADAIHKPEIVEGSKTTDTIKKNTIFFLKNNSATINLTLSDAKITVLEGTELVESTEKASGFMVIVVNGSTKTHNVIYGAKSWEVPQDKAKGFVWSGSSWTVASIDVDSIKSALGDFETLEVKNLSVTGSLGGDAVDTLLNSRLSMYTPIDTVLPMYKVYDANSAVGILQLPRILDKTWSVPRGSANLPPQESDYRIEFKSRYLVGGTSQSIQIAYATDDVNPNVYIRGCMYDTISEIWRFSTWRQLTTDTELTEILKQYPKVGVLDGRLTEIESTCVLYCTNCTDAPVGTEGFCVTFNRVGNRKQMFTKTGDNDWWVRSEIGNSWSDWKKLASTKSDVGLGNVNNTSDANKPISTATQTALNGKQATLVSGTNIKTINNTSLLGSGNISVSGATIDDTKTDTTHVWSSNKTNGEITKFVTCNTSATTLAKDIGSTTYTTGTRLAILFTNGHTKVGTKTGNKVTSNYPTIGGHPIKVGGENAGENFVNAGDVHELIYDGSSFHDITADVIYKGGDETNGYYEKKRNGLIEQFGKITGNSNVDKEVNFPISFTELPILHSSPHIPDNGTVPYTTLVYKITKTAFRGLFLPREPNTSGNGYAHTWIAVGF